ncbi:MAG: response regulator transcription factor [Campylobacterota bacterium]
MSTLQKLSHIASSFSVLYAEDDPALRANVVKFLQRFFGSVYVAEDGMDAIKQFKDKNPDFIITDIKMPKLDGMHLARRIKFLDPGKKIIILSAYDDKPFLYEAIDIGVFRFVKKPVDLENFSQVLLDLVESTKHELTIELLKKYSTDDNFVFIFEDKKLKVANDNFLNFFAVESESQFNQRFEHIDDLFLKHEKFLYTTSISWYDKLIHHLDASVQVLLHRHDGEVRHWILKAHRIKNSIFAQTAYVFVANDVTALNLLGNAEYKNSYAQNQKAVLEILDYIKQQGSSINLLNFYKGLTITNAGQVVFVSKDRIGVKTRPNQQRAINKENKVVISSDLLPGDVLCEEVESVNRRENTTVMKRYRLIESSPRKRKSIRVEPDSNYSAQLYINDKEFKVDGVEDISISAARIVLFSLPAGVQPEKEIEFSISFYGKRTKTQDPQVQFSLRTEAKVLKIRNQNLRYEVVLEYTDIIQGKKSIFDYVAKRQMELIREFKNM